MFSIFKTYKYNHDNSMIDISRFFFFKYLKINEPFTDVLKFKCITVVQSIRSVLLYFFFMKMLKLELSSNMAHPFPLLFSMIITTMITARTRTTAVKDPAIAGTWFGAVRKDNGCEFYQGIGNQSNLSLVHVLVRWNCLPVWNGSENSDSRQPPAVHTAYRTLTKCVQI